MNLSFNVVLTKHIEFDTYIIKHTTSFNLSETKLTLLFNMDEMSEAMQRLRLHYINLHRCIIVVEMR
jgi:hypothetical protein